MKTLQLIAITVLLTTLVQAQSFTKHQLAEYGYEIDILDYDNDGKLELVDGNKLYNYTPNNTLSVCDDTLPYGKLVDLNNDGFFDYVYSDYAGLFNDGSFNKICSIKAGYSLEGKLTLDANNDGRVDLVTLVYPNIYLYLNKGDTLFAAKQIIEGISGQLFNLSKGDYDNDGYMDFSLSIYTGTGDHKVRIYRNNQNGNFTYQSSISIEGVSDGETEWGDYDNDGDLDLLVAGDWKRVYIYTNNGNNTFTKLRGTSFPALSNKSTVEWADINNDGLLDALMKGRADGERVLQVFENKGNGVFENMVADSLDPAGWGGFMVSDLDNDNDLDIVAFGEDGIVAHINNCQITNLPPEAPANLSAQPMSNSVKLMWNRATDDHTPQLGLSYNIKIGTTPGGADIVQPMSSISGYRRIKELGNAQLNTFFILNDLSPGTYYWSVQAIDNAFIGGAFAEEQSFTVSDVNSLNGISTDAISIYPNPCKNKVTINCPDFIGANLYTTTGTLVKTSNKPEIDIQNLQAGMYLVTVQTGQGEYQSKIIKQ